MKEKRDRKDNRSLSSKDMTGDDYEKTWGTPVGQDCIDLDETLAAWLGERLVFLADHTKTVKPEAEEPWSDALRRNGKALQRYARKAKEGKEDDDLDAARRALEWVAKNFGSLWD